MKFLRPMIMYVPYIMIFILISLKCTISYATTLMFLLFQNLAWTVCEYFQINTAAVELFLLFWRTTSLVSSVVKYRMGMLYL